jgi:hypothetical protein
MSVTAQNLVQGLVHISGPELTERVEGGILAEEVVSEEDDFRTRIQLWPYIDPS